VVDVSSVRNILSRIRRVVTGDVILPEDHNLQTDALTALTDVVEAIPEPPPPPPPPPPQVLILSGGDAVNSLCWVGAGRFMGYFILPFNAKIRRFLFYVGLNYRDGPVVISLRIGTGAIVSNITIPAYAAGTYMSDLLEYLVPADNTVIVMLEQLGGTSGDIWQWFFNIHVERMA
jgi:hypothetical protein